MFRSFFFIAKNVLPTLALILSLHSQVNAADFMSFHMDYKETSSELCRLGSLYDTDKSPLRPEPMGDRHRHPYTLFYDALFKNHRDQNLIVGELGILFGSSLLMWKDYFANSIIYGFDYLVEAVNPTGKAYNHNRIKLAYMNVWNQLSILEALDSTRTQYDLIIDDSTHQFEDQLKIIENVYRYLKPGGMLIIEDVFQCYSEQAYIDRLGAFLNLFQDYYFVSMDHKNRYSGGFDNDKVFVLVNAGAAPIFKKEKKMTIITPSTHPSNLGLVKDSINFDYVDEWIIVYDGNKISENPHLFTENPKISEYIHVSEGVNGNPQRNYALDHIQNEDTYVYFLDDNNLMHQDLYKLLDIIGDDKIYTFDMENQIKGNSVKPGYINTAMFLIDFNLCKTVRWRLDNPEANFYYIDECISNNKDKWVYVNNDLCTCNVLPSKPGS